MGKRIDDKVFRELKHRANAATARAVLLAHRAKGGELLGNDYDVLMRTYLKRNKQNWFVGLCDRKSNAILTELADEVLAAIHGPRGTKFLTGSRKTGWAHQGVLRPLAHVLLGLGRVREAAEVFDLDWKRSEELTVNDAVFFMRAAWKIKDAVLLGAAIKAFAEVRHEGFAHAEEWEKYKQLVSTLRATAKPKVTPATPRAAKKPRAAPVMARRRR